MTEDAESLLATAAQARRDGRLDEAFRAYEGAADLSRGAGSEHRLVRALSGLGQIERDRGALDRAQRQYEAALDVSRGLGHPLLVATMARHLGDVYRENGLSERAEPLLAEAVKLYRGSLDTKVLDLANAIRPLALLLTAKGDAGAARPLWQEARALYSSIHVTAGVSECDANLPAT